MSTLSFNSVDFTPEMQKVTLFISGVKSTELKPNVEKKKSNPSYLIGNQYLRLKMKLSNIVPPKKTGFQNLG